MISKTDLRIGNVVLDAETKTVFVVYSLGIDTLNVSEYNNPNNSGIATYDSIIGMPFSKAYLNSKNWLEKEGKPNYFVFWMKNQPGTGSIEGLLDIEFPYDNSSLARVWTHYDNSKEHNPGIATTMEYWHQLQNFVYGLTGKEIGDL